MYPRIYKEEKKTVWLVVVFTEPRKEAEFVCKCWISRKCFYWQWLRFYGNFLGHSCWAWAAWGNNCYGYRILIISSSTSWLVDKYVFKIISLLTKSRQIYSINKDKEGSLENLIVWPMPDVSLWFDHHSCSSAGPGHLSPPHHWLVFSYCHQLVMFEEDKKSYI